MIEDFAELREYVLHYLEARKDKTKATVRRLIVVSVILITMGIAWVAALGAGAVLLVRGIAEAAGIAIGNRFWAGQIIVGGSIVLSTLLVIILLTVLSNRSARHRTIQKYERRHRIQRASSAKMPNDNPLPESQMSEVAYLNQEISDARAALSQKVAGLTNGCAASVDLRE